MTRRVCPRASNGVGIPLLLVAALVPRLAAAQVPGDVGDTLQVSRPTASSPATISWQAAAGATSHNLYRGASPSAGDQSCLIVHTTGLSTVDAAIPAAGSLFYYLVSGVNTAGEGTLGIASNGAPRLNALPCADVDGDLVADNRDNCPGAANASQADQNGDALGDACDPKTYDFESDALGARPAGITQTGGVDTTFLVRSFTGDRGVSYDGGTGGVYDVFGRYGAAEPFQSVTVWADWDEAAASEILSLEFWSDGSWGENAGAGLIAQIAGGSQLFVYPRTIRDVPQVPGPFLPNGRVRLRLLPGSGQTAELRVDLWDGSAFVPDAAVIPIADRHRLAGLDVAAANYLSGRRGLKRITVEHQEPAVPLHLAKHPAWSTDWKIFQRNGAGTAAVPLRFFYTAPEPARLEARVRQAGTAVVLSGHDWADHRTSLPAGTAREGTATVSAVPTGGNYDVDVRLVRESDANILGTDLLSSIAVGDVYVSGGQSNMSGYSGTLDNAEPPIPQVHLFANNYLWLQASEPMDDGFEQVDAVSAEAPAHSLMLRFAKEVWQATGVPVGVIVGPLGGTNLNTQWQRDAADHANRATLYGSLLHRTLLQNYATPVKGFLWYQGESDVGRTLNQYLTDLRNLVIRYREDFANPDLYVLNAQLATDQFADLAGWLTIKEAQRRYELEDARSRLVTTVDQLRADSVHLTVGGYKQVGYRFALAAREMIYGQPVDAGARMTAVRYKDNRNRAIEVVFDAAVSGGTPGEFLAFDDGSAVSISSVSTAGSVLTLNLAHAIHGAGELSYGYARDPALSWVTGPNGVAVPNFHRVPVANP